MYLQVVNHVVHLDFQAAIAYDGNEVEPIILPLRLFILQKSLDVDMGGYLM